MLSRGRHSKRISYLMLEFSLQLQDSQASNVYLFSNTLEGSYGLLKIKWHFNFWDIVFVFVCRMTSSPNILISGCNVIFM